MWFTSDNAGPAHPRVLEAIVEAGGTYSGSYGEDPWMDRVREQIREIFEAPEAAVHLVATGTAANALALATLTPPWGTVYCHRMSHVEMDECGAPEFYTGGAKLTLIPGENARMDPDALSRALDSAAPVGVHNVQKGAVSITQATISITPSIRTVDEDVGTTSFTITRSDTATAQTVSKSGNRTVGS